MNKISYIESGLSLELLGNKFYNIESSTNFKNDFCNKGFKIVDFIYNTDDSLIFVEIKSSSPKDLKVYNSEIYKKFNDTLLILLANFLNKVKIEGLETLEEINLSTRNFAFILVVNIERQYLHNLQNQMNKTMNGLIKLFNMKAIKVMSYDYAKNYFEKL